MKLEGLHHITMITGDARTNVAFYADVLGLRLVKKTVNFDQPDAYHLYFGDEAGTPGSLLTWFEFPGATPGRPGGLARARRRRARLRRPRRGRVRAGRQRAVVRLVVRPAAARARRAGR